MTRARSRETDTLIAVSLICGIGVLTYCLAIGFGFGLKTIVIGALIIAVTCLAA